MPLLFQTLCVYSMTLTAPAWDAGVCETYGQAPHHGVGLLPALKQHLLSQKHLVIHVVREFAVVCCSEE